MKASTVIALVAATAVSAQLSSIPSCALTCAVSSIGSSGCQETDIKCICQATSFITALTPCVQSACSADDLAKTIQAAEGLCSSVGVTLSIPGVGASTAPTSAATSSASSAMTTSSMMTTEMSSVMTTAMSTAMTTEMSSAMTTMTSVAVPPPSNTTTTALSTSALPTATPSGNSADRVAVGGLAAVLAIAAALL